MTLYPMLFEPNMHPTIWGGSRLASWKGLTPADHVGESWEISAVESSPSVVANGAWTGHSLPDVIALHPAEILGRKVVERYGGQMPLLVKFIDADQDLSIQVHPDDEMARREHGKMGKSEMWYVLDAKPGAYLYAGFRQPLSPAEYERRVADGTITEALARHEVHRGDVFYLPAGRVHAIGSGILLAEIQQSSDVTYRIFDYNRPGMDGKPRQLHTQLASQALNYEVLPEYRTDYDENVDKVNKCLDTPYFSVRLVDAATPTHRDLVKYDSFIAITCIKGCASIRIRSTKAQVTLPAGTSCMVPAAIADYDILPSPAAQLLEAYIDNRPPSLFRSLVNSFRHFSLL